MQMLASLTGFIENQMGELFSPVFQRPRGVLVLRDLARARTDSIYLQFLVGQRVRCAPTRTRTHCGGTRSALAFWAEPFCWGSWLRKSAGVILVVHHAQVASWWHMAAALVMACPGPALMPAAEHTMPLQASTQAPLLVHLQRGQMQHLQRGMPMHAPALLVRLQQGTMQDEGDAYGNLTRAIINTQTRSPGLSTMAAFAENRIEEIMAQRQDFLDISVPKDDMTALDEYGFPDEMKVGAAGGPLMVHGTELRSKHGCGAQWMRAGKRMIGSSMEVWSQRHLCCAWRACQVGGSMCRPEPQLLWDCS